MYNKTHWQDRVVDPETGEVIQEGTFMSAEHFNNMEEGIAANSTDLISHLADSVKHITSTERTNWNAAKTHADSAHAPSSAQANVIETVKVNGTALTPSSKAVNITVPVTTDTYSSTGTAPVNGKAVASAIGTLDVTGESSIGAGKTISSWSETDGKVSITTQNISITKSQISDFPSSMTPTSHNQASSTINAMTGYSKPTETSAITSSDTLNSAIGKLEKAMDGKSSTSHTHSSYVNQNAFSNVKVGDVTVAADSTTDTLTLASGTNVTITPDASTDTITISAKDTTYSAATTSVSGLMSADDKTKLDGIATGANKYTLPSASSSTLGGVKVGSNITVSSGTISLTKSNVTSALGYTPINSTLKGANNGIAELDENGKVLTSQLPSYVDDVIEATALSNFPSTGEAGKIYVDASTNKTYRWSGSGYTEISASLALGETSSTAYRGDKGKVAYDHSQATHARTDATKTAASSTNGNILIDGTEITVYKHPAGTNPHGTTKSDVGLGNVPNVATNDQTPSYTEVSSLAKLTSGEKLSVAFGKISKAVTDLISHLADSVKHITSTERTNWNAAKTHADSAHAPSSAQANVIETVKVNGTALTPSSKAVNITVPVTTDTYSSTGTAPVNGKAVASAIGTLDVAAVSVGTTETIKSISETDGKIAVTKQSIAIKSNQVNGMTSYSKATSSSAIATSDSLNTAVGKLEYKTDTNENNISILNDDNSKRCWYSRIISDTGFDSSFSFKLRQNTIPNEKRIPVRIIFSTQYTMTPIEILFSVNSANASPFKIAMLHGGIESGSTLKVAIYSKTVADEKSTYYTVKILNKTQLYGMAYVEYPCDGNKCMFTVSSSSTQITETTENAKKLDIYTPTYSLMS